MVMFREDDERIRAEQRARRSKNPLWRAFRALVYLGCFFGVSLVVLAALGGPHEPLRKGLEDFLAESTGYQASIGTLENMSFFPRLEIDVKDVTLRDADNSAATVGALHVSMPFFSALFSRNTFKVLDVTDVKMAAGMFTPKTLSLGTFGIKDDRLVAEGLYDGQKLDFFLDMKRIEKSGGRVFYRFAKDGTFGARIGGIDAAGKVARGGNNMRFTLLALKIAEKPAAVTGEINLSRGLRSLGIEGDLSYGRSRLALDLAKKDGDLSGEISFDPFDIKDYATLEKLYDAVDEIIFGGGNVSFGLEKTAKIKIAVKSFESDGAKLGHFETPVVLSGGMLRAQPFGGDFSDGKISGALTLDGAKNPAALEFKMSIDALDYGVLQKTLHGIDNVTGTANVEIALKGKGAGMDDIMRDLSGDMTLVAAEGKMKSAAMLNLWGTGLLNVMMPRLSAADDTVLNCMIADFNVENGIADAEVLFLDTERVTVRGEGKINISRMTIDIKLKPEPKDAALIDVSTAIRVRGKLGDPQIAPDSLSLLEKLGEIALGTVNPVFWAYSLTDLGLTENHPCRKYIGNKTP